MCHAVAAAPAITSPFPQASEPQSVGVTGMEMSDLCPGAAHVLRAVGDGARLLPGGPGLGVQASLPHGAHTPARLSRASREAMAGRPSLVPSCHHPEGWCVCCIDTSPADTECPWAVLPGPGELLPGRPWPSHGWLLWHHAFR